jgi:hypothetical protein
VSLDVQGDMSKERPWWFVWLFAAPLVAGAYFMHDCNNKHGKAVPTTTTPTPEVSVSDVTVAQCLETFLPKDRNDRLGGCCHHCGNEIVACDRDSSCKMLLTVPGAPQRARDSNAPGFTEALKLYDSAMDCWSLHCSSK